MKNILIVIFIIVTSISGCKRSTNVVLQGDLTRERILNNEIYGRRNIFNDNWHVQFMIDAEDFGPTVNAINSITKCVLLNDFDNHEISPADVHCWEAKMILFNDTVKVSKMAYKDWELPIYSFNWKESFKQVKTDSRVEAIERTLYQNQIKYTLVDYLTD